MDEIIERNMDYAMGNLPNILAEIDKCLEERYVIPKEVYPWKTIYWTANEYSSPTCIYEDGIVPTPIRMQRTMWLVNEAHNMLIERRYQIAMPWVQLSPVTPWAVMSAAICCGTQEAMLNNDKASLWRQRGLLGPNLGIVGNFPNASERTMRQQLEDNTSTDIPDEDRLYEKVRAVEDDTHSQWQYYLSAKGRHSFVRLVLLKRALWVARAWRDRTPTADVLREQWVVKSDHPWSIIQAVLDNHRWPDSEHLHSNYREEEDPVSFGIF